METRRAFNYDDFDRVAYEGEDTGEGLFSPFTFICIALVIIFYGLMSLYSATFDLSVREGYPHYSYLLNQVIGLGAGLLLGLVSIALPLKAIRRSYFVLCPIAIISLILSLRPGFLVDGALTIGGVRLISPGLLSVLASIMLISGTISSIGKRSERNGLYYGFVILTLMTMAVLTAFTSGMGMYFLLAFTVIAMMRGSGAKRGYSILAAIFLIVTGLFIIVINPAILQQILYSIMPVSDPQIYDHELYISQMAIKDGGIAGVGLGRGLYKLGVLNGVEGTFIISSIVEETGIIGICCIILFVILYVVLGIKASDRAYKKKLFSISGATAGITMLIAFATVFNISYAVGLFPLGGISLPFFSYGPGEECLFVFLSCVLYRFIYMMGRPNDKKV